MITRNAVVAVLGHVDHGKTTLLDRLRRTAVAATEAGGITQRIGAFVHGTTTFLDTPGHAAFRAMRERGAMATDIAVLAVALDDGVMPQTVESARIAEACGVPIVVAMTKADRAAARVPVLEQQLLGVGIHVERLGGDVQAVALSGTTGAGIGDLLAAIDAQAALLDLRSDAAARAHGVVIESEVRRGLGATATVLVQGGTLRLGDWIAGGGAFGRVRRMADWSGGLVGEARASIPVLVSGWRSVPRAGSLVSACPDARTAEANASAVAPLAAPLSKILATDPRPRLPLVVRTDQTGAADAVRAVIGSLPQSKVAVSLVVCGTGTVSELDASLARDGHILTFGADPVPVAPEVRTPVVHFAVIYRLEEHVRALMLALVPPEYDERVIGASSVIALFTGRGDVPVCGCRVTDGSMRLKDALFRVVRNRAVMHSDLKATSLRRGAVAVDSVPLGIDCGLSLAAVSDRTVIVGDRIECYERTPRVPSIE